MLPLRTMDQHLLLARAARLTLVSIALLLGCAHESVPAATTPPTTEAEPETTEADTDTTAVDATDEPAATVAEVEPAPTPEPVEEPPPPEPVDMTPAAAPALCASLVEPGTLRRAAFKRGGVTLHNDWRADVLECAFRAEVGVEVSAYLVLRSASAAPFAPAPQVLGSSYDIPGMSVSYRLGPIERTSTGIRIRVTDTETIYPDTGYPGSGRADVTRSQLVVTCTLDAEFGAYDCEREGR